MNLFRQERKRRQSSANLLSPKKKRRRKWLSYLEQKSELDVEEQRRNELQVVRVAQEFEGEAIYELPAEVPRPEIRSEDCVGELALSTMVHSPDILYTLVSFVVQSRFFL